MNKPVVFLYSDGSCSPNPGNGGWAYILVKTQNNIDYTKKHSGCQANTTNNQMEFKAILEGIKEIHIPSRIILCTDSKLVIGYLFGQWKQNNLILAQLTYEINMLCNERNHELAYQKIQAHSGNQYNEECDKLAKFQLTQVF